MKTIACHSIKGGVGKTAVSVNLAYDAARRGLRTLLVDLDPQGASSFYFRVRPSKKLKGSGFFTEVGKLRGAVRESDYPHLDILPANLAFRNFDLWLARLGKSKTRLKKMLRGLRRQPVLAFAPHRPGANAYRQLCEEIVGQLEV